MVSWGIIGAGNVCEVKSAPAMQKIPNSRLVAVMRRDADKAKDFAKRHNVPKWYGEAMDLIADPEITAIYIATPPNAHMYYTHLAAKAGKAVYVEKPMARSYDECQKMIAICQEENVPLFVAYYRRALPNFIKIKSLIESDIIGDIRHINIRMNQKQDPHLVARTEKNWRIDPQIAGGGYFYDLACHQLDLLDFFFGPVVSAKGHWKNQADIYDVEDIVVGTFEFQNKILGTGSWCFTTSESSVVDETIITGSLGEIRYATFANLNVILNTGKKSEIFKFDRPSHIQEPLITSIVNELEGIGSCPSRGPSGARTNWVMEQIVRG